MGDPGTAPYEVMSPGPYNALGSFEFTTGGTTDPVATVVDHDDIIDETDIDHSAAGIYVATLSRRWRKVVVVGVEILDATGDVKIKATAVVEGYAADNTVTIQTETGAGTVANTTGKKVHVTLKLIR